MAQKVTAVVLGGDPKVLDGVETVEDVKDELDATSYTATVNGEPADDDEPLADFSFVSLSPAVKGGM